MSYRVAWVPSARDVLLQILFDGPNRAEIVGALNRLSATLQQHGPAAGESREGIHRVLLESPLAVKFSVDEPDRVATITELWLIKRA